MRAIVGREIQRYARQYGRLASAIARPTLWLVVFAAGVQNVFGAQTVEAYAGAYKPYQEYLIPGLIGMVLLFNGMQSALALVYDREVGTMRLLLTAPLPRWYLLLCKLVAGTVLSVLQAYAFLLVAWLLGFLLVGIFVPWGGWLLALPFIFAGGFMMGAIGLLLSVHIRQLENFAGTMNFVIFPMLLLSTLFYPLWRFRENDAAYLYWIANANPFTHAVELIRFAAYGRFNLTSFAVVIGVGVACFLLAVVGYDPQRGSIRRRQRAD